MKHAAWLLSVLLVSSFSTVVEAAVIWQGDFESGDFSQWDGLTNEKKGERVNIAIVEDLVMQGTKACRFQIHGDDDFSSTQSRTQITRRSERTGEGQDVYMASYFLMPEDAKFRNQIQYWESDGYKNNVDFWVTPKEGGGTTLHFGTGLLGKDEHWSTDLVLDQWHLLAHHIHWSQDATKGSISVWFDGKLVVDAVKLATKPDNQPLFTQLGFHRAQRNDAVDTIYLDGTIEADSVADLTSLPVPMTAMGGGGSGAGGAAGGGAGGYGGTSVGLGGIWEPPGGSPAGGAGSAGAPLAGSGGATVGGSGGTTVVVPNANATDEGGCAFAARTRSVPLGALALGLTLLLRTTSRRRPARPGKPRA